MASGTVLNPWSYTDQNHISVLYNLGEFTDTSNDDKSILIAKNIWFRNSAANVFNPVDNNRDLIQMLKQIDASLLIQRTQQGLYVSGLGRKVADLLWSPVVERECFVLFCFVFVKNDNVNTQHVLRSTHNRSIFECNTNRSYHGWQLQKYRRHNVRIHSDGKKNYFSIPFDCICSYINLQITGNVCYYEKRFDESIGTKDVRSTIWNSIATEKCPIEIPYEGNEMNSEWISLNAIKTSQSFSRRNTKKWSWKFGSITSTNDPSITAHYMSWVN